tara:strand:+ start:3597 stop:3887 length:291 start_codon:yes stop_codon:yes gene_type:complete
MCKTYQEQLALCKCETEDYSNIWKSKVWTITDYEELFEDINRGYVIQDPDNNYFILNPDWEEEEEHDEDTWKFLLGEYEDCGCGVGGECNKCGGWG